MKGSTIKPGTLGLSPGPVITMMTILVLFLAVWMGAVNRQNMCQPQENVTDTSITTTSTPDYCPNVSIGSTTCGPVNIAGVLGTENSICGDEATDPCHSHLLLPDNSCETRERAYGVSCTSPCWSNSGSYCQAGSCVGPNTDCYGYCSDVLKNCDNDATHGTACGCPALPFVQSPDGPIGSSGTLFNSACMYNSCRYGVMYFYQNTTTVLPSFSCLELLDQSNTLVQTGCIQAAQVSHNYMDLYSYTDPNEFNYQWVQTCTYWFACAPYNTAPYAVTSVDDLIGAASNSSTTPYSLPAAWYKAAVPSKIMPSDTRYRPAVAFMYSQLFNFNYSNS